MGEVIDIFSKKQQTYHELMHAWFNHWYPDDSDWEPRTSNLEPKWQERTVNHLDAMAWACIEDLARLWEIRLDFTPESIGRIEMYITPTWRHQLQNQSDPREFSNRFLVVSCEIGCYLAKTMLINFGGEWIARAPYWESSLLIDDEEIFVFTMIIQKFSEGINNPRLLSEWIRFRQGRLKG